MTQRPAVAAAAVAACLSAALALGACAGGSPTGEAVGEQRLDGPAASSAASPATGTDSNETDVAFLTAMVPHHQQAVEMSEIVLAAEPPTPVADLARAITAAQAPEIEQMEQMLADLGVRAGDGPVSDHASGHGGMLSDVDMAELRAATGSETVRLYLEGMIAHHRGAIASSETELGQGVYEPARALARTIAQTQAAEITRMEQLLRPG